MISPISGSSPIPMTQAAAPASSQSKSSSPEPSLHPDTVTLSHAAQQAARSSADVDHDGDSH
ncbi:MAG: hypothetical protein ACLGSD_14490 [Acidobacteriota bacterium]